MMKMRKYAWLVALLLAMSLTFIGCGDDDDNGTPPGGFDFNLDLSANDTLPVQDQDGWPNEIATAEQEGNAWKFTFDKNNQRLLIPLTEEQVVILNDWSDPFSIEIKGSAAPDTDFRYHLGDPNVGSNWNGTSGPAGPFSSILEGEFEFSDNKSAATLGYFILQQRAEATTVVTIESIRLYAEASGGGGVASTSAKLWLGNGATYANDTYTVGGSAYKEVVVVFNSEFSGFEVEIEFEIDGTAGLNISPTHTNKLPWTNANSYGEVGAAMYGRQTSPQTFTPSLMIDSMKLSRSNAAESQLKIISIKVNGTVIELTHDAGNFDDFE